MAKKINTSVLATSAATISLCSAVPLHKMSNEALVQLIQSGDDQDGRAEQQLYRNCEKAMKKIHDYGRDGYKCKHKSKYALSYEEALEDIYFRVFRGAIRCYNPGKLGKDGKPASFLTFLGRKMFFGAQDRIDAASNPTKAKKDKDVDFRPKFYNYDMVENFLMSDNNPKDDYEGSDFNVDGYASDRFSMDANVGERLEMDCVDDSFVKVRENQVMYDVIAKDQKLADAKVQQIFDLFPVGSRERKFLEKWMEMERAGEKVNQTTVSQNLHLNEKQPVKNHRHRGSKLMKNVLKVIAKSGVTINSLCA